MKLCSPPIPGLWTPIVHCNCIGNQIVAVRNRVISPIPAPAAHRIESMRNVARSIAARFPKVYPQELGEFALEYSGAKRQKYLQAAEDVRAFGLTKHDYDITLFVKPDRLNPVLKRNPDPRPIQFRKPKYCVMIAKYIKAIEPHLYAMHYETPYTSKLRMVAKGLNQLDRARLLRRKWSLFKNPMAATIDGERFDKHMNVELLKVEHLFYLLILPSQEFKRLLRAQLRNRCFSKEGVAYSTLGRRMSGEMNTALGNCVIMLLMVLSILLVLRIKFELLDDGDDCLVIYEAESHDQVRTALESMNEFGLHVKLENVSSVFERIKFCQSQPIETHCGWKFCRDPYKVMSTSVVGIKWASLNEQGRRTYLNGIAECELVLNKGVPVLEAFARALRRNAATTRKAYDEKSGEYYRYMRELKAFVNVDEVVPITPAARMSFYLAFGIDPATQVEYEDRLDVWQFPLTGDKTEVCYMDVRAWVDSRMFTSTNAAAFGENDPKKEEI